MIFRHRLLKNFSLNQLGKIFIDNTLSRLYTTDMKCKNCQETVRADCDWNQGRCPHTPPLIDLEKLKMNIQPKDTSPGHFRVSMAKSAVRIAAGISLIWPQNLILAGIFLIAAEVLGVVEELV
jgi:hypothetical protein